MFHDSLVEFGVGALCGGAWEGVCVCVGGCSDGWAGRGGATLRVTGKGGEQGSPSPRKALV